MFFSKVEDLSVFDFGRLAENKAKMYLKQQGYTFLEANYYTKDGEIDLIFLDGKTLVFVEVRAKRNTTFGLPEETLTPKKFQRLQKTAMKYLIERKYTDKPCRFDVVASIYENKKWQMTHYKDVI